MRIPDLTGKKTVVIDAHGIIYQVFHTMREMSGPKGQPTGAAFGFTRDVMNILLKFEPDYIFCAFDMPGKTFRHTIFPEYKANRPPMPEDLRPQMIYVREIIDALCISRLEMDGYEADDLLATVARLTSEGGGKTILITPDKDARQLITENISLYNLRKELIFDAAELKKEWGIRPDQVVDFQTMVGDSTDNVPGIPLIGPKSAADLLVRYGSLEEIFAHAGEIKGKKGENIAKAGDLSGMVRQLVQLDSAVPIEIDWEKGAVRGIDPNRLRELFREYGFRSLMGKIDQLADQFGTQVSERDHSLDGLYSLTEKKTPEIPETPSLFDQIDEPEAPDIPQLADENQKVTENLFRKLEEESAETEVTYPDIETAETIPDKIDYRLVDTPEEFSRLFEQLQNQKLISIDLETVDLEQKPKARPRFALIAGIALCFDSHSTYYIPFRGPADSQLLPEKETLEKLRPILESEEVKKIGQNIKFDMIVFGNAGIQLRGVLFDTMVADYLLHAGEQRHNLDELAERYLDYKTVKITDLIGTGKNQKLMDEVPTADTARYAGEDALVPWYLYPRLLAGLRKNPLLLRLMSELEIPLISVLAELETNGIAIDQEHFCELSRRFTERQEKIKTEIEEYVRTNLPDSPYAAGFNINSPIQLQKLLFEDLGLPAAKKTKTGWSTDIDVLEELAKIHPFPKLLIAHRTITKLIGTYTDPIPALCHPITHRIHASFNQVVTATGRLSSSDPNLQNIPVRTEEGKEIRRGFVPDRRFGYDTFISCDYSQIELRVLTHFSGDPNLTKAFQNGLDIHAHVAAEIFGVPIEEVTSEQRRKAKAVNFGLVYGQSAFGLSNALDIDRGEAAEYIRGFFSNYPGIRTFFDRVLDEASRTGFVQTLLGRRRAVDGVRGGRGDKQLNMAERTAINTVIQGSAADLMKIAMVNVSKQLAEWNAESDSICQPQTKTLYEPAPIPKQETPNSFLFDMEEEEQTKIPAPPNLFVPDTGGERGRLLLQIHDELLLETRREDADELAALVVKEMELGQPLAVPLKIDAEFGSAWES